MVLLQSIQKMGYQLKTVYCSSQMYNKKVILNLGPRACIRDRCIGLFCCLLLILLKNGGSSILVWCNFTLYLGHFPNTYCFTSPTMCVISPTILLHFPNNFASFPQQYGSFPQQYGSLPQQYESFPQLVFSFPQQFCVTFPNPQKQISPPKKAFFTNLRAIYHVKVPPPQPPFHVFSTISC